MPEDPRVLQIADALMAALEPLRDGIPDLQIYPFPLDNPTPPTVDVYPDDPFYDGMAFGDGGGADMFWLIRARVTTADSDAGYRLLYQLIDPYTGITAALVADQTLGGVVDSLGIGEPGERGVSGFRVYVEDAAINGNLLGAQWRVRVIA